MSICKILPTANTVWLYVGYTEFDLHLCFSIGATCWASSAYSFWNTWLYFSSLCNQCGILEISKFGSVLNCPQHKQYTILATSIQLDRDLLTTLNIYFEINEVVNNIFHQFTLVFISLFGICTNIEYQFDVLTTCII